MKFIPSLTLIIQISSCICRGITAPSIAMLASAIYTWGQAGWYAGGLSKLGHK